MKPAPKLLVEDSRTSPDRAKRTAPIQGDDNDGTFDPQHQGPPDHERRARRQAGCRGQAARREEDRCGAGDEPEPARGHPVGARHRPRAR